MIGTGDGTTRCFQLCKTYGAVFAPYARTIEKPVAGSVVVAVAGCRWPPLIFAVDASTGLVTLATAPAAGQAITAGFLFDVPVRFDTDQLDRQPRSLRRRLHLHHSARRGAVMRTLTAGFAAALGSVATLCTAWVVRRR